MADPQQQNVPAPQAGSGGAGPANAGAQVPNDVVMQDACVRVPTKRRLVRPDNIDVEVPDAKRANIVLNRDAKANILGFLATCFLRIGVEFGIEDTVLALDLTVGARITALLQTGHNINRQIGNGVGFLRNHLEKEHDIQCLANSPKVTMQRICEIITDVATLFGLAYAKPAPNDANHWYGTAAPLLAYAVAWKERIVEMRNGTASMTVKKGDGVVSEFSVSSIGIQPRHGVLCEGLNFNPSLKATMAQSLGPMTQLAMYLREPNVNYIPRWRSALMRTFAHITGIDVILESIRGVEMGAVGQTVTLLGDIALLAGTRNQHRACFPLNFLVGIIFPRVADRQAASAKNPQGQFPNVKPVIEIPIDVNYSGKGMWELYNWAQTAEWRLRGKFTESQASQVVYHAIFATYNEDLSLLKQITNRGEWNTRTEIGANFQEMGTIRDHVVVKLPVQRFGSKLSSAAPTNLLAGKSSQVHCVPVFAGHRNQTYLKRFVDMMESQVGATTIARKDLRQVEISLQAIKTRLVEEIKRVGMKYDMGTVPWFKMDDLDLAYTKDAEFEKFRFATTGEYYLSNSDDKPAAAN